MVERHPYKVDVAGSNPVLPTKLKRPDHNAIGFFSFWDLNTVLPLHLIGVSVFNMKTNYFFFAASFSAYLLISACTSAPKESADLSLPDKEPARFSINVVKNEIRNGLHSLKDRSATALIFYSKPDAYLIKGQKQISPEGAALLEVKERQDERTSMLNEAFVESCEECAGFQVKSPSEVLAETTVLNFLDKAALGVEPTTEDWKNLAAETKQNDLLMVILGNEDTEQVRVIAERKDVVKSTTEAVVRLKVFLFDIRKNQVLISVNAEGVEGESLLYNRVSDLSTSPGSLLKRIKNSIVFGPSEELMDTKLDPVYPYPHAPGHVQILKKTISRVVENLAP